MAPILYLKRRKKKHFQTKRLTFFSHFAVVLLELVPQPAHLPHDCSSKQDGCPVYIVPRLQVFISGCQIIDDTCPDPHTECSTQITWREA